MTFEERDAIRRRLLDGRSIFANEDGVGIIIRFPPSLENRMCRPSIRDNDDEFDEFYKSYP